MAQQTMFDTELSRSADAFLEAHRAVERAKTNKEIAEKDLISAMKRTDRLQLQLEGGITVSYSFIDSKEKVSVKKPKTPVI